MRDATLTRLFLRFRDKRDGTALAAVFDATARELLGVASHLVREPGDAEDLVQITFERAIERAGSFDASHSVKGWLYGILWREAAKLRRRAARRVDADELPVRAPENPLEAAAAAELPGVVRDAVERLRSPYREVVEPWLLEEESASTIAARLDRAPGTVRVQIHRGLERLRRFLPPDTKRAWSAAALSMQGMETLRRAVLTKAGMESASLPAAHGVAVTAKALLASFPAPVLPAAVVVLLAAAAWLLWSPETGSGDERETTRAAAVEAPSPRTEAIELDAKAPVVVETPETTIERTGLPDEETLPGPLYALLDPEGAPVPGAHVVLCRDGEVLALGETDEEGLLATELELEGSAKLLALAPGWTPQIHEVSLTPERHEVALRPGAIVAGWIVVSGYRLSTAIPLELRADRTLFDLTSELGITPEEAEIDRMASRVMRGSTDAHGAFRFDGLAEDWSGILELPVDYRLADPILAAHVARPCSLRLAHPVQNLRVDVVKALVLTGWVVDAAGPRAAAVADAEVEPRIEYPGVDPSLRYQGSERTDELGRFRIALQNPTVRGGHLVIRPPDRSFSREIEIEPRFVEEDWDLGYLALCDRDAIRQVCLLVRDTAGAPIAGAVAGTSSAAPHSGPTDEEGRTFLRGVVPGVSTIEVHAVGYETSTVEVSVEPPEEIEVTMRRATLLDIRFLTPDGEPGKAVVARISAERNPLQNGRRWPRAYMAYTEAGYSHYHPGYTEDGTFVIRVNALREGGVIVNDIEPGLPLHLRVDGKYGTPIQAQTIAPLAPEEHRRIEVVLVERSKTARGRVVDEADQPLPHASVSVTHVPPDERPGHSWTIGGSVEDDGSFEISHIYATHIYISARADGYVPFCAREYEVPLDGEELVVRLAEGHAVTVIFEEECGKRQTGWIWSDLPNGAIAGGHPVEGETGVYLVRGLPDEEVTIKAELHWTVHERVHDPLVPNLTITIPTLGEVEATVHRFSDLELDDQCGLWILPVDGEGRRRRDAVLEQDFTNPVRIPGVLPGRYEAVVQRYLGGYYEEARFEELSPRLSIEILPGEPTRFEIRTY